MAAEIEGITFNNIRYQLVKPSTLNAYATTAALGDYLTKANASETYATKSNLLSYLTTSSASSTYLSKSDATNTYLSKSDAGSTYLSKTDASNTYAAKSSLGTAASKNITFSRSEPTDSDGNDGDIWIVYSE